MVNYYKKFREIKFDDPSNIMVSEFKKSIMMFFGLSYKNTDKWINNFIDAGLIKYKNGSDDVLMIIKD